MATKPVRIVVSGGGTGGHIFPAVAVAHAIQSLHPDAHIHFIGAQGKMEMEKVPEAGYPILGLPVRGIQRSFSLKNLQVPFQLLASIWTAFTFLGKFKPNCVIGFGGYAAGPVLFAARLRRIPIYLQEQNAFAGLTNKANASAAQRIFTAYSAVESVFPKSKIMLTGNPVRSEIAHFQVNLELQKEARAQFGIKSTEICVFITGGSLGAKALNTFAYANAKRLKAEGIQLIWQTGAAYAQSFPEHLTELQAAGVWCAPFIRSMQMAYAAADIVVARAGAITVSELACTGIPTIFVPSPYVAEDHQTHNAKAIVQAGAALLVPESEIQNQLFNTIVALAHNTSARAQMRTAWQPLTFKQAAHTIAETLLNDLQHGK